MKKNSIAEVVWMSILSVLCIACFPINPLVLLGWVDSGYNLAAYIFGWIFWAVGMVLVMAPFVMFPRRGGVPKGKSFVHTTKLVDTGIYSIVRHPQYLGGTLALFVATPLLYFHWLFVVLGVPGILILYWSTKSEDQRLIERFGDDYRNYRQRVPGFDLITGIFRVLKTKTAK